MHTPLVKPHSNPSLLFQKQRYIPFFLGQIALKHVSRHQTKNNLLGKQWKHHLFLLIKSDLDIFHQALLKKDCMFVYKKSCVIKSNHHCLNCVFTVSVCWCTSMFTIGRPRLWLDVERCRKLQNDAANMKLSLAFYRWSFRFRGSSLKATIQLSWNYECTLTTELIWTMLSMSFETNLLTTTHVWGGPSNVSLVTCNDAWRCEKRFTIQENHIAFYRQHNESSVMHFTSR